MSAAKSLAGLLLALGATCAAAADGKVWKSPTCGCCKAWVSHMAANGYTLDVTEVNPGELQAVKKRSGITGDLASCHTAVIAGYTIEGHVPAASIKRLLTEKPDAVGLTVPGMPAGSPGMETGGPAQDFDVLLVKKDGTTAVFEHVAAGASK